jgi:Fe2+ transport system protein FeoA
MSEKPLASLKPGEKGIVSRITGRLTLRKRLMDMGFVKGVEVVVLRKAPLGDPIEYLVKGYNISLRKSESEHIYVIVNEVREGEAPASVSSGERGSHSSRG